MKPEQIGGRIKTWRKHIQHSQESFSELLGMHIGVLKKYEQGKNVPGGDALARFAMTGVNINWLLTGEGNMSLIGDTDQIDDELIEFQEFQEKFKKIYDLLLLIDEDKRESAINEMLSRVQDAARMSELERLVKNLQKE